MRPLARLHLGLYLSLSRGIIRRYFVVNGFDGALTMLGLLTGFHIGGKVALDVVIGACLGAAVALAISGLTSAYLSESAERRRSLSELEAAMVTDLSGTAHSNAVWVLPPLIALVNGVAPLLMSLIIITPLWLAHAGMALPMAPLPASIATALSCIFGLGVFLGRVGGTSWLWSGIKTLLVALVTMLIILLL
jgi:predicted membrane protein (TIGR00267 family)